MMEDEVFARFEAMAREEAVSLLARNQGETYRTDTVAYAAFILLSQIIDPKQELDGDSRRKAVKAKAVCDSLAEDPELMLYTAVTIAKRLTDYFVMSVIADNAVGHVPSCECESCIAVSRRCRCKSCREKTTRHLANQERARRLVESL
jgi:hypothetical protein